MSAIHSERLSPWCSMPMTASSSGVPLGFALSRESRINQCSRRRHHSKRVMMAPHHSTAFTPPTAVTRATALYATGTLVGKQLETLPPFLPTKQVGGAVALAATVGIFLTFTRFVMRRLLIRNAATNDSQDNNNNNNNDGAKRQDRKVDRQSLQATYLLANSLFAIAGIVTLVSLLQSHVFGTPTTALSRAQGHVALGAFGSTQAGYGIWSIAADANHKQLVQGDKRVDEGTLMFIHHVIIIFVGMAVATGQLGFRVYAPFFCGISELSSVPLVLMKSLAKGRKRGYGTSRLAFAVSFLSVRVVAWLVFMRLYLRDFVHLLSTTTMSIPSAMIVPGIATVPLLVLTLLQLNWAYVIFDNLTRGFRKSNDNNKTSITAAVKENSNNDIIK